LYAGLCEGQEKYTEAIDEYLKISDYDDKNTIVFLKLAELYEKTEGLSSAIETLERGRRDRGIEEYNENLAGYYIRNSQPEKALELTKEDLTKARALFDLGKNQEGYDLLMSLGASFKNNQIYHSLLAQYYFQVQKFDEAFAEIDEYAKLAPNSPLIYQMRALIFDQKNDAFNEHVNWGKYNIVRGNKDVALNEYLTAYRFNSNDVDLIETIAVLLETSGDKTKACEFYERLVEIDDKNSIALQKLAEFRESIGDYSGALEYIEKLKTVDSRNQYALENYEKIKDKVENGTGFLLFLKNIFGKRMG
jgi:tetratricopeptide (TPR) repeat protein